MDDDCFTMQEMNFVVCVLCERYNLVWLRNLYCLTDAEKATLGFLAPQRRLEAIQLGSPPAHY